MAVLKTRMVGYAPDPRGREKPLEVVYLCEEPPRRGLDWPLWMYPFVGINLGWLVITAIGLANQIATGH